jgi:hypothetical protein
VQLGAALNPVTGQKKPFGHVNGAVNPEALQYLETGHAFAMPMPTASQ